MQPKQIILNDKSISKAMKTSLDQSLKDQVYHNALVNLKIS